MWSKRIEVQRATAGDELDMRLINKEYGNIACDQLSAGKLN